jgi:hypothetical protein
MGSSQSQDQPPINPNPPPGPAQNNPPTPPSDIVGQNANVRAAGRGGGPRSEAADL